MKMFNFKSYIWYSLALILTNVCHYIEPSSPPETSVASSMVAARRRLWSSTQLAVTKPRWTQNSSKHLTFEFLGKQVSMSHLNENNLYTLF